jgi:hypothetical protein
LAVRGAQYDIVHLDLPLMLALSGKTDQRGGSEIIYRAMNMLPAFVVFGVQDWSREQELLA